jgi:phosphoribosylformylglycinamidine synthase
VTPDIKLPGRGRLFYIDLGKGAYRMGGSALAQCFMQTGDMSPDIEDAGLLKRAFNAIQRLLAEGLLLSGHDRSDGGLVTTLLEMAFAGNCGLDIRIRQAEGVNPEICD